MKALFLAASAIPGVGKTKISFRDINGGDENNDFRSGSNTGVIPIDVYGDNPFEIGKTYLMEITEFVPADENAAPPVATEQKADTSADEPQSIEFEGKVTITTLGKAVTISVASNDDQETETSATDAAPTASREEQQQEEQTNTQEEPAANAGATEGTGDQTGKADAGAGDTVNDAAPLPDTQEGPGTGPTGGDNKLAENVGDQETTTTHKVV
jgi:hypothetical protein